MIPVVGTCCTHNELLVFIEQPELHLHPRAQCALGDLFIAKSNDDQINTRNVFVLETHSEHLVLRILRRIRETTDGMLEASPHLKLTAEDISVSYFEATPMGTVVHQMAATPDGDFLQRWPEGFFPERGKELFG